jgi:hypothetical protein
VVFFPPLLKNNGKAKTNYQKHVWYWTKMENLWCLASENTEKQDFLSARK